MKPFTLNIENDVLEGISYRLKSSRLAEDIGNSNWNYGTERNYLEELLEYWISEYDWKKTENEINSLPNFICEINDVPIHFIHIKSPNENSKPIILTHGWPWTFWDYKKIIKPLTNPEEYGGKEEDSFDVVVPSLPGFGFSTPLRNCLLYTSPSPRD